MANMNWAWRPPKLKKGEARRAKRNARRIDQRTPGMIAGDPRTTYPAANVITCRDCRGRGRKMDGKGKDRHEITCPVCHGSGGKEGGGPQKAQTGGWGQGIGNNIKRVGKDSTSRNVVEDGLLRQGGNVDKWFQDRQHERRLQRIQEGIKRVNMAREKYGPKNVDVGWVLRGLSRKDVKAILQVVGE
jgi:hypothetical protein